MSKGMPTWISAAAATRVDLDARNVSSISDTETKNESFSNSDSSLKPPPLNDFDLGFRERAFSAAGAACISAVIVNPLDVAKVTSSI